MSYCKRANCHRQRLSASTLIEVLVILAVAAVTVTGVAAVNIRSITTIKDNETLDTAMGVMVQALELAKSPKAIPASGASPTGNFRIDYENNQLVRTLGNDPPLSATSICTEGSTYYVSINAQGNAGRYICLQISISQAQRPLTTQQYYIVTARVLFNLSGGAVVNQLVAYRRGEII